ncbi:redox-sensitive transcriptional activator SoxR [Mycobacterium sp. 141]|uniref:redox-sensitive transcriptional activator SoxR n=1 Tax=Mycobacterium sp. 141 TaxID=1120797 RepID=UPI000477CFE6|nr:redox-sensitive transcriptional activator SoxR [Mycobacterium sp. 141]
MSHNPTELLTVGEVAQRAGMATSAVRFYEQQGLITSTRTSGNQRRYPRHVLRRISIIQAAQRFGVTLAEVAAVLSDLPDNRMPSKSDWTGISRRWHAQLEARRREIEHLESELTGCIGCGCLSLATCRIVNPDDALSRNGPGPRRLITPA